MGGDRKTGNSGSGRSLKSSHPSQSSQSSQEDERLLAPRGDYHNLLSFQKAEVLYDITYNFTQRFLLSGDRTRDQMVQAARSGKKNLLEGSKAALTSKETEIKLTNVARASLEELLDDYLDFLRARKLPIWDKDSKEALYVRELGRIKPQEYTIYSHFIQSRPANVIANIAICLIHQANFLIDHQLTTLEREFLAQGGLRERMTRLRLQSRTRSSHPSHPSHPSHLLPEFPDFPSPAFHGSIPQDECAH